MNIAAGLQTWWKGYATVAGACFLRELSSFLSRMVGQVALQHDEHHVSKSTIHSAHTLRVEGNTLFYQQWLPKSESKPKVIVLQIFKHQAHVRHKALIIFLHGLHEHSGRFAQFAPRLADDGFACCAVDHRGHGRSDGIPGYFDDVQRIIGDAQTFIVHCRKQFPGLPCFVLAHSFGGLVTVEALREYDADHVVLSPCEVRQLRTISPIAADLTDPAASDSKSSVASPGSIAVDTQDEEPMADDHEPDETVTEAAERHAAKVTVLRHKNAASPTDVSPAAGSSSPRRRASMESPLVTAPRGNISPEDRDLLQVQGLILHAPLVSVSSDSEPHWVMEMLAHAVEYVYPSLPIVAASQGKSYHPSRAASERAKEVADPLVYTGKLRVGTGLALRRALVGYEERMRALHTPLLIQHGTADRVCSAEGSRRLYERASSADRELRLYNNAHHDLMRERPFVSAKVFEDLLHWINARIP